MSPVGKLHNLIKNLFSSMKMFVFWFKFHWNLLTMCQHWFRQRLDAEQVTSHYLNQWWFRLLASLSLKELTHVQHWSSKIFMFLTLFWGWCSHFLKGLCKGWFGPEMNYWFWHLMPASGKCQTSITGQVCHWTGLFCLASFFFNFIMVLYIFMLFYNKLEFSSISVVVE